MERHWNSYMHFLDCAKKLAQSDAILLKTNRSVMRGWDEANNMPRYRVGLIPDADETVLYMYDSNGKLVSEKGK